jgi:hypothetical protein
MRKFLLRAFLPSPAVGAAIAAFFATLVRPDNPDTLWHLAIGRWILANHMVPDINRFYYSTTSGFGYDYSWLSQALLFVAYRFIGGAGIAILTSVAAGFIFYLLYKILERDNENMLVNFVVLGLAVITLAGYLTGRPAIVTVTFLTLEVFILSGFVQSRSNLIWLIPPVVALWANLHAGFIIAPLVILLFLPLVPEEGRSEASRGTHARWQLVACLATSGLAILANPYGWRMYLMPFETLRTMPMLRGLSEWRGVSGWEAVIWGGLVAAVACGFSLRRQRFPLILLVAVFALGTGLSDRNMPLFGVVALFALGRTLLPVLMPVFRRFAIVRKFDMKQVKVVPLPPLTTGGWFWAIAIPLVLVGLVRLRAFPMNLEFDFSGYPTAALRYVDSTGCPGNLFEREIWSGYQLWRMPDRRLFFDAKGGFSREAADDHSELVRPGPNWRDVADRNGVSAFLLERGSPLTVVLSEAPDWERVYSDSLSEVFERRVTK